MVYTKMNSKWTEEFNSSIYLTNVYQVQIYELDFFLVLKH